MNRRGWIRTCVVLVALGGGLSLAAQEEALVLPIVGRITDGEKKLEGCEVLVYDGNDMVGRQLTDRGGRFHLGMGLGKEFAIEFRKEGFLPKRILVDTRAELPKDLVEIAPLDMEMSMLPTSKYDGADTDVLDFPFAIVKYDKRVKAFTQDSQYTSDMMRTNGALLLMSVRSEKK
ncbi:MAG TPA: hypothetical protein VKG92_03185 [Flavobacteriales bacterium]|nr:hypothetical protein [Flavobacteriales bacterium]